RVSLLAADRAGLFARCFAAHIDDVHSAARLLPAWAKTREIDRVTQNKRLRGAVLPPRHVGHQSPLESHGWFARISRAGRRVDESVEDAVLPERPVVPVVRRRLVTRRRAALRDERSRSPFGSGD